MNVTSTESPACAASSAATLARDVGGAAATSGADAAAFFLGLLAQVAAPPAVGLPVTAVSSAVAADDASDTEATDAPVEWVMPFLPPVPVAVPLPPEPTSPATGAIDDVTLVTVTAPDGTAASLLAPPDEPLTGQDSGALAAADPARAFDASESVAIAGAPRVEAAGSGAAQVVVRHIPVAVGDRRWPEQVGHELRILVERGVQSATLHLTPEHLGPVDVRIDIVNDKANVVFGAANGETRTALTEAIPRLREMFAGAGLTLGDAGVRQDTPGRSPGAGPGHLAGAGVVDGEAGEQVTAVHAVRMSLVDAYA